MQTGKFTIFDYDKLQDESKREHYEKIINYALTERYAYMHPRLNDYTTPITNIHLNFSIPKCILRAQEITKRNVDKTNSHNRILLRTANEKMLFVTNFVFPDNQNFLEVLNKCGIDKEACINFSEEIKSLIFYSSQVTDKLTLLMIEYFETLDQVKKYYGTNNTGVIINKILEIAYLKPELLHTKEKS